MWRGARHATVILGASRLKSRHMAYDTNNVFARILRGEIPAHKVFEDEHTLAFMDVMPQAAGACAGDSEDPGRRPVRAPGSGAGRDDTDHAARRARGAQSLRRTGHHDCPVERARGRAVRLPHPFPRHTRVRAASICGFTHARWQTTRFSRNTPHACAQRSIELARARATGRSPTMQKPLYAAPAAFAAQARFRTRGL